MFMGVFATSVIGFGALGVDISYIAMSSSQAQAVADAASHAALVAYRTDASSSVAARVAAGNAAAQYYVDNNNVGLNGERAHLDQIQFGIFNPSTGNFSAGAQPYNAALARVDRNSGNSLQLFLAPILGQNTADVEQEGVTAANPREIFVVVDRSCSMAWGSPVGYQSADLALEAFADYMINHQVPLDRLGITDFSENGSVWDPLRYVDGNEGAIATKWSEWADNPGYAASGCTNQQPAINLARNALNTSGNELAFKAMIVISDGNPTCGGGAAGFLTATDQAWDDDIHVWTVGFGSSINDSLMESATKGVGTYYRLPSGAGLTDVMLDIARSIPVVISE